MSQELFASLESAGVKTYKTKENYKETRVLATLKVDSVNRVVTGDKAPALQVVQGEQKVYIPLRQGVLLTKSEYTIGEFEAVEDIEFNGITIAKGTVKHFAY